MPHYLFETGLTSGPHVDAAIALSTQRFPEVALEHRYAAHDDNRREVWVCRAPNEAHLQRWAAAAHLELWSLQHVDVDVSVGALHRVRRICFDDRTK
jgi:hypothetical protein